MHRLMKRNVIIWSVVGVLTVVGIVLAFVLSNPDVKPGEKPKTPAAKEVHNWDRGKHRDVCPPIGWRCHPEMNKVECNASGMAVEEFNKQAGRTWFVHDPSAKKYRQTVTFHHARDEMNTPQGMCFAKYSVKGDLGELRRHEDSSGRTTGFTVYVCWNKIARACIPRGGSPVYKTAREICRKGPTHYAKHELGHVPLGGDPTANKTMENACDHRGGHPRWTSGFMNADAPSGGMGRVTKLILDRAWKECQQRHRKRP